MKKSTGEEEEVNFEKLKEMFLLLLL